MEITTHTIALEELLKDCTVQITTLHSIHISKERKQEQPHPR